MTQDIIEMAEGCGFTRTHTGEVSLWLCNKNDLERLIKLVADKKVEGMVMMTPDEFKIVWDKAQAEEREACAEMCKKHADVYGAFEPTPSFQAAWAACIDLRDQIRARGEA